MATIPSSTLRGAVVLALALLAAGCDRGDGETARRGDQDGSVPVRVASSESALALLRVLAIEAREREPDLEISFLPPAHSAGAVAATAAGEADLGVLTRIRTSEEERAGLHYMHLAWDGLVFATHRDVPVKDLSRDQLRAIYSGTITNWSDLGGPDLDIVVLDRPEHTSAKIAVRSTAFFRDLAVTPAAITLERPEMMNVSLESLEGSIGYTSLGEVIARDLDVNVLDIGGVRPSPQNVEDGSYPLARPIGMVLPAAPGRNTMHFIEFVYGDEGHRLIRSLGYAPIAMTLVVGLIPERDVIRQEERYRPLADYLSRNLGGRVRVQLRHLRSYDELVQEFLAGRIDAAFFGSYTYALTRAKTAVELIARPESDGVSTYRGLIFTRRDSGIRDWRDLEGRSFAMIADTTAGDVFPRVYLKRRGVLHPPSFLGRLVEVGSHDLAIRKVLDGEVDAGAAKDLVFDRLAREDPRIERELRVLAKSEPVPENALVVRSTVRIPCARCHERVGAGIRSAAAEELNEPRIRERLRQLLLNLDQTQDGRHILEALGADRFIETTDADYANLYRMIDELWLGAPPE